jgi:D-alanine transfer protein
MNAHALQRIPHLVASLCALAVSGGLIFGAYRWSRDVQEEKLHAVAPEFCDAKLHGVALIREAFSRPDTLVFFGSSELIPDVPMKGVEFFSEAPTGFSVFPVGKAGTTSLSVLQKLGGAGEALKGKKLVISLSPSFFQTEQVDAKYFAGNSSKLQTKEMLWDDSWSKDLRKSVAQELLLFPKTYEGDWLLEFTLRRMTGGGVWNRFILGCVSPLAAFDRMIGRLQDHAEAAIALMEAPREGNAPEGRRQKLNWDELFRRAEIHSKALAAHSSKARVGIAKPRGSGDRQFLKKLTGAQEWRDFELVLRLIQEAGAKPLIISMPLHADILEQQGVSEEAMQAYGNQLKALTAKFKVPLVYFQSHEKDPVFFVDQFDHIGAKGWCYYNKVMDDFYHGRLNSETFASSVAAPNP